MGLALHVILRLDQEDCILGRGLTLDLTCGTSVYHLMSEFEFAQRNRGSQIGPRRDADH
jgi:hypothetical protein